MRLRGCKHRGWKTLTGGASRLVTESNCVVATRGGEQLEVKGYPTNNQAEQSLRPIVILRKVLLCTCGQENHSVLHTLIQTARRQGRDVRLFLETLPTANASTAQAALYRNTS